MLEQERWSGSSVFKSLGGSRVQTRTYGSLSIMSSIHKMREYLRVGWWAVSVLLLSSWNLNCFTAIPCPELPWSSVFHFFQRLKKGKQAKLITGKVEGQAEEALPAHTVFNCLVVVGNAIASLSAEIFVWVFCCCAMCWKQHSELELTCQLFWLYGIRTTCVYLSHIHLVLILCQIFL